jgi:hypothetical protein
MSREERAGALYNSTRLIEKFGVGTPEDRFPVLETRLLESIEEYRRSGESDRDGAYVARSRMALARHRRETGRIDAAGEQAELRVALDDLEKAITSGRHTSQGTLIRCLLMARLGRKEEALDMLQKFKESMKWQQGYDAIIESVMEQIRNM